MKVLFVDGILGFFHSLKVLSILNFSLFVILKCNEFNEFNQENHKASLYNVFGLVLSSLLITTVLAKFQRLNDLLSYWLPCSLSFTYFRHVSNFFYFSIITALIKTPPFIRFPISNSLNIYIISIL